MTLAVLVLLLGCKKNEDPAPEEFVFPSKVIHKIVIDDQGVKWFATEKGVISFNGTTWTSYKDEQSLSTGYIPDLAYEIVSGVSKLWLAGNSGLAAFEFGTSVISFKNFNSAETDLLSDSVLAVGIDRRHVKYVGTSRGMSILSGEKWDSYLGRSNEQILARFKISSIATSADGYVYAATSGGGVSRFRYSDAISGATTFNRPWAWGLPSDTVYTVITSDTCQWYGTNRGAAFHSSEYAKQDWVTYTRAEGLVCDSVYAIARDLSGNVWFGTHKGISKLAGEQWQSYTKKDGLVANKINALAVDPDGSIWIGTDEGISHFANNQWVNY